MYGKEIQLYVHILFKILFRYSLLQDIEFSSQCYTVDPYCLSFLFTVVYKIYLLYILLYMLIPNP